MKTGNLGLNVVYREHFLQECQAWSRELDFLVMEVSFLKTRLSQVVDAASERSLVAIAEDFQNKFILTEETLRKLSAEVKFQCEQVNYTKGLDDAKEEKKVSKNQAVLRSAMQKLENDFSSLRKMFNQWVMGIILGS